MLIRAHVVALRCNSSVREEAVGVAAVHEAMPFTDGVVLLSLQKTRKAGVDEIWHRGAWLCHCQGGAVDRPTFLPRLDVGVLRSKARPIAAVPLLHLAKRSKGAGRGALSIYESRGQAFINFCILNNCHRQKAFQEPGSCVMSVVVH